MEKLHSLLCSAILIALLTLAIPNRGIAQTTSDAYVSMENSQSSTISGTYYIILSDTSNVSQIETTLGTASSLSDLLNQTYDYDVATGLPTGYTYSRQGNKIILGITNITANTIYYGSVRIKNGSGTWSSAYNFITN